MFPDMSRRTVLVVGTGSVGKLAADAIRRHGVGHLWVTSRTEAHGRQLAKSLAAEALPWSSLSLALSDADIVLTGTGSPSPVLTREMVASAVLDRARPRLLIDLAVPRDIEPSVADLPGVTLLDIDDIQIDHHDIEGPPKAVLSAVASIIDDEVRRFNEWRQQANTAIVAKFRQRAEAVRERELARTLARLPNLTDEERQRIEGLSRALVNQLLHEPTVQLKDAGDSGLANAAEKLFGLSRPSE
jgi:glutamyl-tRNA reductase